MSNEKETFILKIYRGSPGKQYWEEFELELQPSINVISALMEIQKNPVNIKGERVAPVVWEQGCLEEVCGSCSMLVNSIPRQACSALIEPIIEETGNTTITLAPFTKFPLIRDLMVDRTVMFENLKKVKGWIETDGVYDKGPGPRISPEKQEIMYSISTCMTCGCCTESCPQVNKSSSYIGPQPVAQVRLFNSNPNKTLSSERLDALADDDGLILCGNSQNCVRVCPKNVPLTDSIAEMNRDLNTHALKKLFSFPNRD